MVAGLARAIVLDTMRSSRTHSGLALTHQRSSGIMESSRRSLLCSDFFNPQPRQVKRKDKARELQEYECGLCARHIFLHREVELCLPLQMQRRIDCTPVYTFRGHCTRPRNPQKHPSHHLPHSVRRRTHANLASRNMPIICQTRHASNLSDGIATSSKIPGESDPLLSQVFLLLDPKGRKFDLDSTWDAYIQVKTRDGRVPLDVKQSLTFGENILEQMERDQMRNPIPDIMHMWSSRLCVLLEDIKERPSDKKSDMRQQHLMARISAIAGDFQQAMQTTSEVFSSTIDYDKKDACARVLETIVVSAGCHSDAHKALDIFFSYWDPVGKHLMQLSSRKQSFRRIIDWLLSQLRNPERLLMGRDDWDPKTRLNVGNTLLDILCNRHLPHDAFAVLQEMQAQQLRPLLPLQLALVRALARDDAFERANTLFSSIPFSEHKLYLTAGLYLYAHQGKIVPAQGVYAKIERLGWLTPGHKALLMQAYAVNGNTREVITLFHQFFPELTPGPGAILPNIIHYTVVIHAHAVRGDLAGVKKWLDKTSNAGLTPDIHVYTVVVKALAKAGDVDSIGNVLDEMRAAGIQPGVAVYTVIVSLLGQRRDPLAAEGIYKRALREGVIPDRRLVTAIMNAHVEAGTWPGVIRVFDYLKSVDNRRLRLSIEVYNTLLKAYILIGAPFRIVAKIFQKLEQAKVLPDAHTYALLIQSACDAGFMNIASDVFLEMDVLAKGRNAGWEMNAYVLTIIMSAFLRRNRPAKAKAVYKDMQNRGIDPTSVTFGNIIRWYANKRSEESIRIAEAFLKQITEEEREEGQKPQWEIPTGGRRSALEYVYSPLMTMYARRQRPEDVERLYSDMLSKGGEPSLGILTTLLNAYRRTFNIKAVLQTWPLIHRQVARNLRTHDMLGDESKRGDADDGPHRQINLLCVPLSVLVDALSAAGQHSELATVWRTAQQDGVAFDAHNWNHLIVALVRAGEPERAMEILEKVILPYQRMSRSVVEARDMTPTSPLLFDAFPQQSSDPASADPLHRTLPRAQTARLMGRLVGIDTFGLGKEGDVDFAHPLHILHQISPAWNIWRVHWNVKRLLVKVLQALESGFTITPIQAGDPSVVISRWERRELAEDMLGRIYANYPNAVQLLQKHERRYRDWDTPATR